MTNGMDEKDMALLAGKIGFFRNSNKLAVFMAIYRNENCSTKEILQETGLSFSLANHGLTELKREFLVSSRKGQKHEYSLTELGRNLAEIIEILARLEQSKFIVGFEKMKLPV